MSSLGNLWYTLGIRDLTDADLQRINNKLRDIGATLTVNPVLAKSINDILPKGVDVDITPNKVAQDALDRAVEGKAMKAEILPLADKLKSAVIDALKDTPVPLNGVTIPPDKLSAAITNALSSANFTSIGEKAGDEFAKAIKVKVEGQPYHATVTAKTDKLTDTVTKALDRIFGKDQKIKLDRSDIKTFRDELRNKISESIKVTPTLNITQQALQSAVEGKVMRVEILPLLTNLRQSIKTAFTGNPLEIEIGPNATKLRNLVTGELLRQGYMVNISTVTGLEKSISTQLNGRVYNVKIRANATEIANSVQASLMQVQSRQFGLTVAKDVLRKSIDDALMAKPFSIQIAVMHDQTRRAVQNALNNARMVGKDDALAYQRLQTGELRAAQAELARLKAAHQSAASAAKTHASASVNLGSALGRNMKIVGELGTAMGALYSVHAAKQFLSQVVEIGGELEHQKIALETIYGTSSKMEGLYGQIKSLARQSPFGVMELTKNVKQLSAYGVAYNEVYDTAKRLADISAATSVDIQRLILAFGKTKNRTFLDGLEAKQFAYANIPIYDMLSKKLTELEGKFVSVKDVMGRIKKREIGFDMVKDILWDMTDEGGKFYNMQEKLAGSVKTSWKLVRDNIELMFGEIAESSVGDGLKRLAEILQGMTREWKTLAPAIAAAGIAFGVYKTAVMMHNMVAGKSIAMAARQEASLKMQRYHANLAAQSYRTLTQAEEDNYLASSGLAKIKGINVLWSKKLTAAEAEVLVAKKLLSREDVLRLVALRKLTAADAQYVLTTKGMTAADIQEMNAQIARAAAAKRSTVIWGQLKASMAGTLATLRSFAMASLPLAAIGAMMSLWSRNNEEMQKAKEIGDAVFSKAADGAKELKGILEEVGSSKDLSELEVSQGIERMVTAIKDLSPTPIDDINDSLVAQDGHVRTLTERFNFLRGRLQQVRDAYQLAMDSKFSDMIEGALKATDGNWFTGLFSDDLVTNAKDYTNALKRREDRLSQFAAKNKKELAGIIDEIAKTDTEFAKAVEGMASYEERLKELITFSGGKYQQTVLLDKTVGGLGNVKQIREAYEELLTDTDRFVADLNAKLSGMKINPAAMTDEQKTALTMSLRHVLDSMEQAGDDAKAVIAKKWESAWNIVLMEDKIGPALKAKFKKLMGESTADGIEKVRKTITYEGYDALSKAGKKVADDTMKEAKKQVMSELSVTNQDMAAYLAANPLTQIIQLAYTDAQTAPSDLMKEMVAKNGYPGLTDTTEQNIREWTKSGSIVDAAKSAKEAYDEAKQEYDAAVKYGIGVEAAKKKLDEINAAIAYGKFDVSGKNGSGSSSSSDSRPHRDMLASRFKEEFADLRDGWAEVQKLAESLGIDAAMRKVEKSSLFSHFDWGKGPKSFEDYRRSLVELRQRLFDAGKQGHPERETLFNDITKKIFEVDRTLLERNIQEALDAVSRELQRQTADWNLFDRIRKATGNHDLAVSVAFGLDSDADTDYPTLVRRRYDRIAGEVRKVDPKADIFDFDAVTQENLSLMPKELQKAYREARADLEKYAREQKDAIADILNEYQSLSDKLAKIDADRERKIEVAKNATMEEPERAALIQRINVEADYQKFTQSNEYLQFFNDIYGLTMSEANRIGDLIQLNLNQKLQAGLITIYDYEQQMEKVRQQLDALRNVKSNALTFMTGGVKGLNEKRLREEEGKLANNEDYQKALKEQIAAQEALDKARESGNEEEVKAAEEQLKLANESLKVYTAVRDAIIKDREKWQGILDVTGIVSNIAGGMSDAFNTLRDMADSFGFDTDSNAWNTAASVMDTLTAVTGGVQKVLQSLMSGDIGGVISGAFDTLLSPITIWNKLHDRKLDRMIEKSKEAAQIMQNQYDILEKQMANFLGNAALMRTGTLGGGYGKERELMQGQLAELQKQRQAEIDKKKTDDSAVRDYDQQIAEMRIAIRDFALEAAKDLYGIDLNGWAEQLGDALVNAFAAGEDAAEAFDKTVGDIMRSVTSKMISQDILAPMFGDLRDYLFGKNGKGGAFGSDFQLDPSEMGAVKAYLDKIKNEGIPAADELFKAINDATGGILNDTGKSSKGATRGLQVLTEDTGDLLVSYVNAVRADTAGIRLDWDKLVDGLLPQINVIAEAQLTAQRQIAENTLRNAIAAEAILKSNESIYRLLSQAANGGARFYVK